MKTEREDWFEGQDESDPERSVFVDEAATATNRARRYARAPRGQRCRVAVPHAHYKTTTVTAGLRASGLIAPTLREGAMNGERFRRYVEQVLAPTLKPGDIVILDNLPAHKVAGIHQSLAAVGARLLYLPPCSPDFNPIEQAFVKLKALLRTAAAPPLQTCARPFDKRWIASPQPSAATASPPQATKTTWPLLHDRMRLLESVRKAGVLCEVVAAGAVGPILR